MCMNHSPLTPEQIEQMKKLPKAPYLQKGGAFKVSGYMALALLALAVAEAGLIRHLYAHRTVSINFTQPLQLRPTVIRPTDDNYVIHTFPEGGEVCDSLNTICYSRI